MRPRVLAALLVLTLIAGGLIAISTSSATAAGAVHRVDVDRYVVYQAHEFRTIRFRSADGNVTCEIYETTTTTPWSCAARRHTWAAPRLPRDTGLQAAGRGAVTANDVGGPFVLRTFNDPADAVRDGTQRPMKVLAAGSRIAVDGISCTMARPDREFTISCSTARGARMVISRSSLRLVSGRS
jgi:hypothetical protein